MLKKTDLGFFLSHASVVFNITSSSIFLSSEQCLPAQLVPMLLAWMCAPSWHAALSGSFNAVFIIDPFSSLRWTGCNQQKEGSSTSSHITIDPSGCHSDIHAAHCSVLTCRNPLVENVCAAVGINQHDTLEQGLKVLVIKAQQKRDNQLEYMNAI